MGFGNVSSYFLKLALPHINNSLFNISIEKGEFIALWKVARITPVFKDGEKVRKAIINLFQSFLSFQNSSNS